MAEIRKKYVYYRFFAKNFGIEYMENKKF